MRMRQGSRRRRGQMEVAMGRQIEMTLAGEDAAGSGIEQRLRARLPSRELISISDVAAAMDVSIQTVFAWKDCGAIRVIDLHGGTAPRPMWRVTRESLLAHLARIAGSDESAGTRGGRR